MSHSVDDDVPLGTLFDPAATLASDIEDGKLSTTEIQERLKNSISSLERLTILVNKLGLFSSNEQIEDVPTDSLQFLLIPCFLGLFHQNLMCEPKEKLDALRKSKIYFKNFLERLRNLTLIEQNLPWDDDEEVEESRDTENINLPKTRKNAEESRKEKLDRHKKKKVLKQNELRIKKQLEAVSIDDGNLRELYITQLQFWCEKSFEELNSIDEEIPLLKMMAQRENNPEVMKPAASKPSRAPMKPFIITRDAQQKQVFGLGYPSMPTLTVDEWYHQRFGHGGGPASAQMQNQAGSGDCESSDDDNDLNDEAKREKEMKWDEYKDDHRRGWGNTHNKG